MSGIDKDLSKIVVLSWVRDKRIKRKTVNGIIIKSII